MRYMNDYDIEYAVQRFFAANKPNRLGLALVVRNLAEWADENSDGWAYWLAPRRAADKAMAHIESTTNRANDAQEQYDISDRDLSLAMLPIKRFCNDQPGMTRDARDRILRGGEVL